MLSLPVELTHDQANACLSQLTLELGAEPAAVVVNAQSLQRFDSSALAVLLELRRTCMRAGKTMVVQGLPKHLLNLAILYGIESLLPTH